MTIRWLAGLAILVEASSAQTPPPVIDVHFHAGPPALMQAMLAAADSLNVRHIVLLATEDQLNAAAAWPASRVTPALTFPCENGRSVNVGMPCYRAGGDWPDLTALRAAVQAGQVRAFGEMNAQYFGIALDDARLEPYWALAEELDVPVGIHMGIGPPGVAYNGPGFPPHKSPDYAAPDARALERVLVHHPRLRAYVMHALWPYLDDMLYLLYMHPQLYVDIAGLQWVIPRPAYYEHLRRLVDAGFANRIMFGSDGNAQRLRQGVTAILEAPFLNAEQKRAILHDNAVRFFRLKL